MAQGIQIGDAVLKMFVDWTEIDQVGANLPAHLKPGTDAAISLGQGFDSVGKSAGVAGTQAAAAGDKIALAGKAGADAFKGADTATQALVARIKTLEGESKTLESQIAQLQARIAQLGPTAEPSIRRVGTAFHEAQGEAALLGELTGVRLPRHVRSFVASLPGVGTALTAAFEATAILFIIEAVVQLGEKVQEFLEKPEKIAEAWKNVSDSTVSASRDMTKALDESAAKVIGLTEGPIAELDFKIKNIGIDSKEAAAAIGKIGDSVTAALNEQKANAFAVAYFGGFKETSREVADDSKKFFASLKTEVDTFGSANGLGTVADKLKAIDIQIRATTDDLNKDQSVSGQHFYQDRIDALNRYKASLIDVQKLLSDDRNRVINEQEAQSAQRATEADTERGANAVRVAKQVLDARLASIETVKAQEQAAFDNGKATAAQWSAAQIKAANDSADAQVRYKQAIAASAFESLRSAQAEAERAKAVLAATDSEANKFVLEAANQKVAEAAAKARGAAEDAANERINENNKLLESAATKTKAALDEAKKIREEWDKQTFGAAKAQDAAHALDELTRAEDRLAVAQKNLEEAKIAQSFGQEEAAIQKLAQFGIISEEQKADRLKVLYAQEEAQALDALNKLYSQEKAAAEKAKKDFEAVSGDPLFSDAELADLKRKWDEARTVADRTQAQILSTQKQFEEKSLSQGVAYTSQSVAQVVRAGQQQLQAEIAANRARVTAIDEEIKLAKARHEDTTALEQERKATEAQTASLVKQDTAVGRLARGLDSLSVKAQHDLRNSGDAVKTFAAALNNTGSVAKAFGATMLDVYTQVEQAQQSAVASAILGQQSWGAALAEGTKTELANIAARDLVWGFYWLGRAIADSFWNPPAASAEFAAAGILLAQGAAAAAISYAIPGSGNSSTGSSASGGNNTSPSSIGENGQASQQPVFVENVQHLGTGGMVNKRTRAVIGDDPRGGDAAEAVIPLDDERAKQGIANALFGNLLAAFSGFTPEKARTILPRESVADIVRPQPFARATLQVAREAGQVSREAQAALSASGTEVHNHYESLNMHIAIPIKGVYDDGNLHKLAPKMAKEISKAVEGGKARLKSSTTYRVTKRG